MTICVLPGLVGGFLSGYISRERHKLAGALVGSVVLVAYILISWLFINETASNPGTVGGEIIILFFFAFIAGLVNIITGILGGWLANILQSSKSQID